MLTKALMQKAMQGETDPKQLEFYVTVEYYVHKKHATDNVDVNNPFPQPQRPQAKPSTTTKAKDSPAAAKPASKKEEKGILESISDKLSELWDWGESSGTATKDKQPTVQKPDGKSPAIVKEQPKQEKEKDVNKKCFCNRDLTVEEFKSVISQMRDSEGIKSKSIFTADNCTLNENDKSYEKLTEVYNKVLEKYDINTCIRKIHFFAQTYWEADRFKTTVEYSSGKYLNPGEHKSAEANGHSVDGDGPRYKGRGLMQLTWRNTYIEYFEYIVKHSPLLVNNKTVEQLLDRKGIYSETYFYFELNKKTKKKVKKSKIYMVDSASLVGSDIDLAVDSAGWFWKEYKKSKGKNLNDFSDYGDKYVDKI